MNAPTPAIPTDLAQLYDRAADTDRRALETHILVSVLPRAAEYAIESENNAEYAARACSDVPAALLRLWQEVGRFVAQPDEERASAISKLMRQILSAQNRRRELSALDLAIRKAVRLANGTERERTLMVRLGKQYDRSDELG
jgi:hypothetical protein